MKNFFEPGVKNEILLRIDKLTPDSVTKWGKMNVNQCLRHLTLALEIPTGKLNPTPAKNPPMPKWLMKFFLVNFSPPKGKAETYKELNVVANGINPEDFQAEKKALKAAIDEFYNSTQLITENKLGGKFSKNDWGKLTFNHTDHHLRQFGV